MTYYFFNFDQDSYLRFSKRFIFLKGSSLVKNSDDLQKILSHVSGELILFIRLSVGEHEPQISDALFVKKHCLSARIIYVLSEGSGHEEESLSFTGGDALIPFNVSEESLQKVIKDLSAPAMNPQGNRLEEELNHTISEIEELRALTNHPLSQEIDQIFTAVMPPSKTGLWQSSETLLSQIPDEDLGVNMSDKDQELSLENLEDLELSEGSEIGEDQVADDGLDLNLDDGFELEFSDETVPDVPLDNNELNLSMDEENIPELSLNDDSISINLSLSDHESMDLAPDDSLSLEEPPMDDNSSGLSLESGGEEALSLGGEDLMDLGGDDLSLSNESEAEADSDDFSFEGLDAGGDFQLNAESASSGDDLSQDALDKLKEIDAIMDRDASDIDITFDPGAVLVEEESNQERNPDEPLVSDDINLDHISFDSDETAGEVGNQEKEGKKKIKRKDPETNLGNSLQEIAGAYTGEMERTQATISNLRADREELLAKIQSLEEDKMLQNRQTLSMRAELDEKKIELTIIRKKLNEEISELKDRLKLFEEKKLILEEKNRLLALELDKAGQKSKIDVKKVMMRERELEQRLELLKADSETQIRNRDLKILELKRKIDAMEFDMESISQQEKRSVESRFELEDKLDKAIKTLRSAISVLENESDRGSDALEALKKNIDM
jgi:hypothetical protein